MKNMFSLSQAYKPTEERGLTSRMSSLANEVKVGHREPLGYATKTIDFRHWEPSKEHHNMITYMQDIALVF